MKRAIIIALGLAVLSWVSEVGATQFAVEVVSYETGTGFATDWNTGIGFTNRDAIIGAPARATPGKWGGPITPFSPPYLSDQILSIGRGGEVTVVDRPGSQSGQGGDQQHGHRPLSNAPAQAGKGPDRPVD